LGGIDLKKQSRNSTLPLHESSIYIYIKKNTESDLKTEPLLFRFSAVIAGFFCNINGLVL
jgi:hypothetical protein